MRFEANMRALTIAGCFGSVLALTGGNKDSTDQALRFKGSSKHFRKPLKKELKDALNLTRGKDLLPSDETVSDTELLRQQLENAVKDRAVKYAALGLDSSAFNSENAAVNHGSEEAQPESTTKGVSVGLETNQHILKEAAATLSDESTEEEEEEEKVVAKGVSADPVPVVLTVPPPLFSKCGQVGIEGLWLQILLGSKKFVELVKSNKGTDVGRILFIEVEAIDRSTSLEGLKASMRRLRSQNSSPNEFMQALNSTSGGRISSFVKAIMTKMGVSDGKHLTVVEIDNFEVKLEEPPHLLYLKLGSDMSTVPFSVQIQTVKYVRVALIRCFGDGLCSALIRRGTHFEVGETVVESRQYTPSGIKGDFVVYERR